MILDFDSLPSIRGNVTMVDGSFDPLHDGHVRYFEFAASLGIPVFCNIASDDWTKSKHPVLLEREKRAIVIDSIRHIDFVHCTQTTTADILRIVEPKNYVKGADWRERGGIPPDEATICSELGIKVVYADTALNSSSQILKQFTERHD